VPSFVIVFRFRGGSAVSAPGLLRAPRCSHGPVAVAVAVAHVDHPWSTQHTHPPAVWLPPLQHWTGLELELAERLPRAGCHLRVRATRHSSDIASMYYVQYTVDSRLQSRAPGAGAARSAASPGASVLAACPAVCCLRGVRAVWRSACTTGGSVAPIRGNRPLLLHDRGHQLRPSTMPHSPATADCAIALCLAAMPVHPVL
jgi:hypothetical protein